jgi:hypothetical protein
VHTPYHISLCIVLLPVSGLLQKCALSSHQIVDIICICYLFLFTVFILMLGLVLPPLFHFQFSPQQPEGCVFFTNKLSMYKVVQIWPGQTVTCLHTNRPGHVWTTLYNVLAMHHFVFQFFL